MPALRFVGRHPRVWLIAPLALVALLGFIWYQSSPVPRYPGAQNLRYETPLRNGEWMLDCGHYGQSSGWQAHTRITRFETSAAPEAVLHFYTVALADRGPYQVAHQAHKGMLGYGFNQPFVDDGERAIFEYDSSRNTDAYGLGVINGYGVVVDAVPVAGQTTVQIIEYQYERNLGHSCHP
jgi:hypothetical protein